MLSDCKIFNANSVMQSCERPIPTSEARMKEEYYHLGESLEDASHRPSNSLCGPQAHRAPQVQAALVNSPLDMIEAYLVPLDLTPGYGETDAPSNFASEKGATAGN